MPKFILKDRNGIETTYEGDVLTVPSPEGEKLPFTYGAAAQKEVELDMAEGDQVLEADEGTVLTAVTVKKPETLVPENIPEGVNIGGVVGTFAAAKLVSLTPSKFVLNGLNCIRCNRLYDNGYFHLFLECSDEATGEVLAKKDIGTNSINYKYVYGYDFDKIPQTQPFNALVRVTGEGFAPSDAEQVESLFLVAISYEFDGCTLDNNYGILFAGDEITPMLMPNDGHYIPKQITVNSEDGEVLYTYDNFTGKISLTVPQMTNISFSAVAPDTPWLHAPELEFDDVSGTITVLYIDSNAEKTPAVCNGEEIFNIKDAREGLCDYEVTEKASGASYGFTLQSDGYYKEASSGGSYRAALCKVEFEMATEGTVTLTYVHYGYSSTSYGIISNIDCTLSTSYSTDIDTSSANVYTTFKSSNSASEKTLSITVPAGSHFIYLKFRRYSTSSTSYYFKFKVSTEPAAHTVYNLLDYFPDYGNYPIVIQSVAEGYTPSDEILVDYSTGVTIEVEQAKIYVTESIDGISAFNLYIDGALTDTIDYNYAEDFYIDLEPYNTDDKKHDVCIEAVGDGISSNHSNIINTYTKYSPIYGVTGLFYTAEAVTRTDDSAEMSYTINEDGTVTSDFDNVFPWNKAEIVTDKFYNKFLQMPKMYFRIDTEEDSYSTGSLALAGYPIISSVAVSEECYMHDGDWYEVKPFLIGCYGASVTDEIMESKSGGTRITGTPNETRDYMKNLGDDTYYQMDYYHYMVLSMLWWIEFSSKTDEEIMTGRVNGSGTAGGAFLRATGGTDAVSTQTGYETEYGQMKYHNIEDFIGNLKHGLEGLATHHSGNINSGRWYKGTSDITRFEQTDYTDYTNFTLFFDHGYRTSSNSYTTNAQNDTPIKGHYWVKEHPFLCPPYNISAASGTAFDGQARFYAQSVYNLTARGSSYDESTSYNGLSSTQFADSSNTQLGKMGTRLMRLISKTEIDIDNGILTITNTVPETVADYELYIDGELVDIIPYDHSEDWQIQLNTYTTDNATHNVYVRGIGDGFYEDRSPMNSCLIPNDETSVQ